MSDTFDHKGAQDSGSNVTRYNSLVFVIQRELAKMNVGVPVKVVTAPYTVSSNGTKTAITPGAAGPIGFIDVQPLVNQVDGNNIPTPHKTVYQLAYHRYQGGNGAFISDPAVDDIGHMVVADRDTSAVLATGAQANPGSGRRNDLGDGIYLGSVHSGPPVQWFTFTETGFNSTDRNGNTFIGGNTGVTINGVLIRLDGHIILPNGVDLYSHIHSDPQGGTVGPPEN